MSTNLEKLLSIYRNYSWFISARVTTRFFSTGLNSGLEIVVKPEYYKSENKNRIYSNIFTCPIHVRPYSPIFDK